MTNDPNKIVPALRELKPGEKLIYHIGFLSKDRGPPVGPTGPANINFIGNAAMDLWKAGKIHLTQRRLGFACYEYIATGALRTKYSAQLAL